MSMYGVYITNETIIAYRKKNNKIKVIEGVHKLGYSQDYVKRFYTLNTDKPYKDAEYIIKHLLVPEGEYIEDTQPLKELEQTCFSILDKYRMNPKKEMFRFNDESKLKGPYEYLRKELANRNILVYDYFNEEEKVNRVEESEKIRDEYLEKKNVCYDDIQENIVNKIVENYTEKELKTGTCILPTGYGKTYIAGKALKILKPRSVLILCPNNFIISEWKKIVNLYELDKDTDFTFSTYAGYSNIADTLDDIEFTIYDEVHRISYDETVNSWGKCLTDHETEKRLFLTATPKYYKKQSVDEIKSPDSTSEDNETVSEDTYINEKYETIVYDNVIEEVELYTGIKQGILSDVKLLYINKPIIEKEGRELIIRNKGILDAIKVLEKDYCKRRIVLYFNTRESAKICNDFLVEQGYNSFYMDRFTEVKERNKIIGELRNEKDYLDTLKICCNCRLLNEGVSIPLIDTIFFCESRFSLIDIKQIIGRGLRQHNLKNNCMVVMPLEMESLNIEDEVDGTKVVISKKNKRMANRVIESLGIPLSYLRTRIMSSFCSETESKYIIKFSEDKIKFVDKNYTFESIYDYALENKKFPTRTRNNKGTIENKLSHILDNIKRNELRKIKFMNFSKNKGEKWFEKLCIEYMDKKENRPTIDRNFKDIYDSYIASNRKKLASSKKHKDTELRKIGFILDNMKRNENRKKMLLEFAKSTRDKNFENLCIKRMNNTTAKRTLEENFECVHEYHEENNQLPVRIKTEKGTERTRLGSFLEIVKKDGTKIEKFLEFAKTKGCKFEKDCITRMK
jgi:superfamily II DNA or RNA helicase